MKLFSVFIKKNDSKKIEDVILIKDGFAFFALLFPGIWFLFHKMWREFVILLLVTICLSYITENLSPAIGFTIELSYAFLIALNANNWRGYNLRKRKGYKFRGMVFGNNTADASLRLANLSSEFDESLSQFDLSITNPRLFEKQKNFAT